MHKLIFLSALFIAHIAFAQEKEKQPGNAEELDAVVIENEAKSITNKNGNTIVDVANSIFSTQPNTLDLLSRLPKIRLSTDRETISVIGKGSPLLYIDNQKVSINELNTLDVSDIKTIEIINNPSSKYEANGRAVILITRKFSKKEGYKITLSENAILKRNFNNYAGMNSSFKTGKLEFKANFNFNQIKVWESNGNNFTMPTYGIISDYLVTAVTKRPQFIYGGGMFYKINDDDYFSVNLNGRNQNETFDIITQTHNEDGTEINDINTLNRNGQRRNFYSGFVNYNHKIKNLDAMLFSGFQYSGFNQQMQSVISNDYNQAGPVLSQYRNQDFNINVFSGRIDLEKKFKNDIKLELGGLYLAADADTGFNVETINPPSGINSDYSYKEQNIAAYSQLSGSYKKLNFTAGLRAENTIVKGRYSTESDFSIAKNYINIFPKAQIEMVLGSSNIIDVNYAKTISRPDFSSTSQVRTYINPYFVWSSNINLDPAITDEISIGYQYKDKSVRITYYKTSNPVYFGASYDDAEKLILFTTTNFDRETNFNIDIMLPFKYRFWTVTNQLNFSLNKIEDDLAVVKKIKPNLYYYSNHDFKLPKKIGLQLTGWGLTKQQLGIFEKNALFTMNAAVSKTFFQQLECTISWNDIFRKMTFRESFIYNNVSAKGVYFTDSHSVSIAVRYNFGKIKSAYVEKGIDENSGRIK